MEDKKIAASSDALQGEDALLHAIRVARRMLDKAEAYHLLSDCYPEDSTSELLTVLTLARVAVADAISIVEDDES